MDPATLAAIVSGIGAAGQVAGGFLAGSAGTSEGSLMIPTYDPFLSRALQASNFDLMNQIGFGSIRDVPDPVRELTGRIQAMNISEKTKRRALMALPRAVRGIPRGRDPWSVSRGNDLEAALSRLGIGRTELTDLIEQQRKFKEDRAQLEGLGLDRINLDTIKNRALTARTASELLGSAAQFARSGGEPTNPLQQTLLDRDNRNIRDAEQRLGILANFGGINPATMFEQLTDARLDQQLRLIEQQLGVSGALQTALSGGATAGSQAAGQSTSASLNSAQIAAQQAMAANQLRAQAQQNQMASIGNGIASGASSLASGLGNAAMIGQMSRQNDLFEKQLNMGGSPFSAGLNPSGGGGSTYDSALRGVMRWGG